MHVHTRNKSLGGDWTGHEKDLEEAEREIQPALDFLENLSAKVAGQAGISDPLAYVRRHSRNW
jgi:hypothetical protein